MRMGVIQGAVLVVLREAKTAMRPCEVHHAVQTRLDRPISYETAASFLSVAARDESSGVARARHGRYKA